MTYICYHHKIIPENNFALTLDGQLVYNGRCVEAPRSPHLELVECTPQSSTSWEVKRQGPVWGSLRLRQVTAGGQIKESCIAQVWTLVLFFCLEITRRRRNRCARGPSPLQGKIWSESAFSAPHDWPPYGIRQAIIFSSCGFFFLLLFSSPILSRRRLDVSTILLYMRRI